MIEYRIKHDGMIVAMVSGPVADRVYNEAMRYAAQYSQDIGVTIVQVRDDKTWRQVYRFDRKGREVEVILPA